MTRALPNASDARKALEIYSKIAVLDQCQGREVQRVTVYRSSACISGPHDIDPKFNSEAIAAAVLGEIKAQRKSLTEELAALGFAIPAVGEAMA